MNASPSEPLHSAQPRPSSFQDIGWLLRMAFAAIVAEPLPARLQALLDSLGHHETQPMESVATRLEDGLFKTALTAVIPYLRNYGRSLSGSADLADDLVQETMLKAWTARQRFVAGTSMQAWTHVILRNVFFSMMRRSRFRGEWDARSADLLLAVRPAQEGHVALGDLQRALMQLPVEQREALLLIGASGMSCEEVAAISQCAIGTVKSRVARARLALRALLDGGQLALSRAETPASHGADLDRIMQQASRS